LRLKSLVENIKTADFTLGSFFLTLLFLIVIRNFFENIFEQIHLVAPMGSFYDNCVEYLHIVFSWISVFLSVVYILNIFDKDKISQTTKVVLSLFCIIIIVPVLDYFIFGSGRILYETNFDNFWFKYIYLFDITKEKIPHITNGVRVEIAIVFIMSFIYIYLMTQKIYKAILAAFFVYSIIYFYGYLPAVVNAVSHSSYEKIVQDSILPIQSAINLNFYTYLPIFSMLGLLYYFKLDKKYRYMIVDSFRIDRLLIYIGIFLFAFFTSAKYALSTTEVFNLYDMLRLYSAILSLVFGFAFASVLNNIADFEIDKISNKDRALIRYDISQKLYSDFKNILLFLSLSFAIGVNESYFFIMIAIVALSYIYSIPPLRLRRLVIVSNLTLSIIAVLVFLLGVCVVEGNAAFIQVHFEYLIAIFIFYFTASHFKDFKDKQADKQYYVVTLATLFEQNKLEKILKIITFIVLIVVMLLFDFTLVNIIAFAIAYIFGAYIIKNSEHFIIFLQLLTGFIYLIQYFSH